jgi:sec-independent protein translocase protein TatB
MNFFGVGPLEIFLVMVIAVVVLGPERIPGVAVEVARLVKFLRGYATDATSQLREEMGELTREYEEVRKELQEFRQSVRNDLTAATQQMTRVIEEVEPIMEPGGELPPERAAGPNGAQKPAPGKAAAPKNPSA